MVLKITDGKEILNLKDKFCISLELEVNKIDNSKEWIAIGNHLYYFVCPNTNHPKPPDTLKVDDKYFLILKNIIQTKNFI
jgi:hypothetical protein